MSKEITVILSRDRSAGPRQSAMEGALLAGLEQRNAVRVLVTPHLYDVAPEGATVQAIRSIEGDLIVLAWLYPRSMHWLLAANQIGGRLGQAGSVAEHQPVNDAAGGTAGSESTDRTIWCLDLRESDDSGYFLRQVDAILAKALPSAVDPLAAAPRGEVQVLEEATRPRWYPVVDHVRCTDCKECLNFCLFGVYGLDASGGILVEEPDACRPGCPACARICPAGAIMFPQHKDPAIAGDPQLSLEGLKLDLSQIFMGIDPAALAAKEREIALAELPPNSGDDRASRPLPDAQKPTLDQLVDQIDGLDL